QFKKYLERIEDPNYQGGSWALPENPTTSEKTKYELCEKVIKYKRNHKFTTEKLAQKLQLSKAETEDILYCRIDYLTLDRLLAYTDKLFAPAQKVCEHDCQLIFNELAITKITITDYYQTKPGRKMITHELIVELIKTLDGRQAEPEPKKNPHDREVFVRNRILYKTKKQYIKIMGYKAEEIERKFRSLAHNLKEDCQLLAKFFDKITELKNAKSKITRFESQTEFEENKRKLTRQCQEAINGLQIRTGSSTSIGGVCLIWADYADHLDGLISAFRRDLESLNGEIDRIPYDVGKKLKKLKIEEQNLKRTIEENLKRANSEKDPDKKRKLLILVDEDKKKLQTNYEEQKKIRIGENFDPDKSIDEFINGIEDKLAGRNRPSRNPRTPNIDPTGSGGGSGSRTGGDTSNPLDPFQTNPNSNPNQNPFQNKQLIIFAGIAVLKKTIITTSKTMTNPQDLKNKLGEYTKELEQKLEPWQRGTLILALITLLLISIYLLTKKEPPQPRELTDTERKRIEAIAEERILKRAEFLNRLRK
ncbi:13334_t:CDS:2, partial [Funneliformis geosporum]